MKRAIKLEALARSRCIHDSVNPDHPSVVIRGDWKVGDKTLARFEFEGEALWRQYLPAATVILDSIEGSPSQEGDMVDIKLKPCVHVSKSK